jgi:hypothetical protein
VSENLISIHTGQTEIAAIIHWSSRRVITLFAPGVSREIMINPSDQEAKKAKALIYHMILIWWLACTPRWILSFGGVEHCWQIGCPAFALAPAFSNHGHDSRPSKRDLNVVRGVRRVSS